MKTLLTILLLVLGQAVFAQLDEHVSTMDFVQILNDNRAETIFYYQNNWSVHRQKAVKHDVILSYDVIETTYTDETPYHLILVTTYANQAQFEAREENFTKLIEEKGGLSLLNDKQPSEFRKIIFNNDKVRYWQKESQ